MWVILILHVSSLSHYPHYNHSRWNICLIITVDSLMYNQNVATQLVTISNVFADCHHYECSFCSLLYVASHSMIIVQFRLKMMMRILLQRLIIVTKLLRVVFSTFVDCDSRFVMVHFPKSNEVLVLICCNNEVNPETVGVLFVPIWQILDYCIDH